MTEANMSKCKICNELKLRIMIGRYPNGKNGKFVDATGKQWSGRTCPACNTSKAKNNMQRLREQRKSALPKSEDSQ